MVRDLRRARGDHPDFPKVVVVHQGDAEAGRAFFARHAPGAHAIADPERWWFDRFGRRRGGLRALFGPAVWKAGLRALRKGLGIGRPSGDVRRMPGCFLIEHGRITWAHEPEHAGDHPDWAAVARRAAGA